MNDPQDDTRPNAEQVAIMTALADRIINEVGRDQFEVDLCNACLLVLQLVCTKSSSVVIGEAAAMKLMMLSQQLLKDSVTRQVAEARLEIMPPGTLEQNLEGKDPDTFGPVPSASKKPYLN